MIKQKDVLIIILMTSVTTAAWIGFNIYHIAVTSTIGQELQTQISPIDPNFDINTINKLKGREQLEPLYQFVKTAEENNATDAASVSIMPKTITIPVSPTINMIPQETGEP